MRLFLCGGGCKDQTKLAYKKFNEILDKDERPLLYIPLAMTTKSFEDCYNWIKEELKELDIPSIEMVKNIEELEKLDLNNYSSLFIGGGNTYHLLSLLKSNKSFDKIKEYILNDGLVFASSAGAVICGENIDTIKYMDPNDVNLEDTKGINVINNLSIYPHYTNKSVDFESKVTNYLLNINSSTLALPEEVTLYIEDGKYEVCSYVPYYLFDMGNKIIFNDKIENTINKFKNINTCNELMEFMNDNITYGYLGKNDKIHINNLNNVREDYKTSSIIEILNSKVGTCVEHAKLIKYFLDNKLIENKIFCHRRYENEENLLNDVKMYCIVLFKENDKWYHFEHSNYPKRGIHEYINIDTAIEKLTSGFGDDIRVITEIPEIPDNLSFREFNLYVNVFPEYKKN